MRQFFLVGIGGFLGAVSRFKMGAWILHLMPDQKFPLSTFAVNVLGCCVAGVLAGILENQTVSTSDLRLFLFTGILGGFTTFSAFGLETVILLRRGDVSIALANIALSIVVALLALWVGLKLGSLR